MYIFQWLMKRPIIMLALWLFGIAAIILSMTTKSNVDPLEAVRVPDSNSEMVGLNDAPTIKPSTLTTALVTGDKSDKSEEKETSVDTTEVENIDVTSNSEKSMELKPVNTSSETGTQFSEMNPEELLFMAREAYWNNGLEESAQIYQQLISVNPDVIDYKGELGNVYWRQGFPNRAALLYAEISLPMIEDGDLDKVANMVGFIGLYYPDKATDIHNALQAASN